MSGQTIEIINTDAEGRLVLADVLWYVQERFKPAFMVDLATLTGAILVALGQEYAGLFSNNDELAERLAAAGQATGEKVWRMPLGPAYDKMIDSKFADMKNAGGRHGGSITAAQFLQRFVNDTPWAHLDIAGTAMNALADRDQQELGLGLGRAPARPAGAGSLRAVITSSRMREGEEQSMTVTIEKSGPVTTVIHSRPEARNAMDAESAEALTAAFLAFDRDPAPRSRCSGARAAPSAPAGTSSSRRASPANPSR